MSKQQIIDTINSVASLSLAAGIVQDSDPRLAKACMAQVDAIKDRIRNAK